MEKISSAVPVRATSSLLPLIRWAGLFVLVVIVVSILSSIHVIGPGQIGLKLNKAGSSRGLS